MERLIAGDDRVLSLEWDERREAYKVRVLVRRVFGTPSLFMTPYDWHCMRLRDYIQLECPTHAISFRRWDRQLEISVQSYGKTAKFGSVGYLDVIDALTHERGVPPATGWEKAEATNRLKRTAIDRRKQGC